MVNFSLLAAEIGPVVWGTPANFNGFRVLAALLHGSQVVSVSQTLRRWTEGATYVWQGGHHVGHWPTLWYRYTKHTPCNLAPKTLASQSQYQLECGPMPNVMAALSNIGGAL